MRMGGKFKLQGHTDNIYHHIMLLIEKNLSYVILMIGTNDATTKSGDKIVDEML